MTERHVHTAEFEANVDHGGNIRIPEDLVKVLDLADGGKVSVRVTGRSAMTVLNRRGVTNEEIDRIAAMQLESPDQVVKFLLTEGILSSGKRKGRGRPGAAR